MGSSHVTAAQEYATDEEVVAAIGTLSAADSLRISRVAAFRAAALAALGLGMCADDLMQEAIFRTITGRRRWRRGVAFVTHVTKTIRSIASHAPDELKGGTVLSAIDDAADDLGGVALRSGVADGERAASAKEQLAKIAQRFEDDDDARLVLERLANDMTGPEIQAELQISQTHYETIMTRLRRGVNRREGWRL